jgi:hypothetical protein
MVGHYLAKFSPRGFESKHHSSINTKRDARRRRHKRSGDSFEITRNMKTTMKKLSNRERRHQDKFFAAEGVFNLLDFEEWDAYGDYMEREWSGGYGDEDDDFYDNYDDLDLLEDYDHLNYLMHEGEMDFAQGAPTVLDSGDDDDLHYMLTELDDFVF